MRYNSNTVSFDYNSTFIVSSQINFHCKPTFREGGSRCLRDVSPPHRHTTLHNAEVYRILIVLHVLWQNEPLLARLHVTRCVCLRQQNVLRHHWVHRRRQEGKCRQCGKVCHAFRVYWRTHMQRSSVFMPSFTFIAEFPAEVLPQQGDCGHQLLLVQAGSEWHVSQNLSGLCNAELFHLFLCLFFCLSVP